MRDIRDDLRQRLGSTQSLRDEVEAEFQVDLEALKNRRAAKLQILEAEELALRKLLEIEERRMGWTEDEYGPTPPPPKSLPDFIAASLKEGIKSKEDIKEEAQKAGLFAANDGAVGRIVHMTLRNMTRGGRIIDLGNAHYSLPAPALPARKDKEFQPF